jgi:hypothetical protein
LDLNVEVEQKIRNKQRRILITYSGRKVRDSRDEDISRADLESIKGNYYLRQFEFYTVGVNTKVLPGRRGILIDSRARSNNSIECLCLLTYIVDRSEEYQFATRFLLVWKWEKRCRIEVFSRRS